MKVSVPTIEFSDANVMKLFAEQVIICAKTQSGANAGAVEKK